jgi:hypothetical protein
MQPSNARMLLSVIGERFSLQLPKKEKDAVAIAKFAKNMDATHIKHMKKLRPKARFKTLSKADQYTVTARTLAHMLGRLKKENPRTRTMFFAYHVTTEKIDRRYLSFDPVTGFLTDDSFRRIRRATARAMKSSLGKDAYFMFAMEQQDKYGSICAPHLHILAVAELIPGRNRILREDLSKLTGDDSPGVVEVQRYSSLTKRANELAWNEADTRRLALYAMKNDQTRVYRSRNLLDEVHARFEELKRYYLKL